MKKISTVFLGLFATLFPFVTSAHVAYVISSADLAQYAGPNWPFILEPFTQVGDVLIMVVTVGVVATLIVVAHTVRPIRIFF